MRPLQAPSTSSHRKPLQQPDQDTSRAPNCTAQLSLLSLASPGADPSKAAATPDFSVRRRRSSFTRPKRKGFVVPAHHDGISVSERRIPSQLDNGVRYNLLDAKAEDSCERLLPHLRLRQHVKDREFVNEHSAFTTPESAHLLKPPLDMKKQLMHIKARRKRPRELTTTIRRRVNLDSPEDPQSVRRARFAQVFMTQS